MTAVVLTLHEVELLQVELERAHATIRSLEDRYLALMEEHAYLRMSQPQTLTIGHGPWIKGTKS